MQVQAQGIGIAVTGLIGIAVASGAQVPSHVTTTQIQATQTAQITQNTAAKTAYGTGSYTVRSGDTLAAIAGREYGSDGCWPGIYSANSGAIRDPNLIYTGQRLAIPGACGTHGPAVRTIAVPVSRPQTPAPRAVEDASSSSSGETSFQACVIRAESGGNADVWNASGHWGLYQFSAETWAAAGGEPGLFGNASATYQTEVFWKAYALWGTSPWAPYDGC